MSAFLKSGVGASPGRTVPPEGDRPPLALDGTRLRLDDLEPLALGQVRPVLAPGVREACERSRRVVEEAFARGQRVYGVNTGLGDLAREPVDREFAGELQRNLVRSHCAGMGEPLPDPVVRLMIALRVNSLARGFSGVRPELLAALLALLDHGILPIVPSRGSVGASGDLAPLAHIALGLMGEGRVRYRGREVDASEALAAEGLEPFLLQAKEGLALINGTQLMSAVGGLALARAGRLLKGADIVAGMSLEALLGTDASLAERLHTLRPHPGQEVCAANLRRCLRQSALVASHRNCHRVQDAYSLRCIPQVHGAARDGFTWAVSVLEREINSVTDNPLVFPQSGEVVSGGNFHGAPLALALDTAAVALSYLGSISERRCFRLLSNDVENLPPFLTPRPGVQTGLMLAQYTAAALASENKVLCHPASADSIPTSGGQEDHVSMGATAAFKLESLVANTEGILACEWVCAARALEFHRPLTFGPGTEAALRVLRERVSSSDADGPLAPCLEAARELIQEGEPTRTVEEAVGPLG